MDALRPVPLELGNCREEVIRMQLELDVQEQQTLAEVLRSYLSELKTEISHTDRKAYRDQLRVQDQLLRNILNRVDRA